SPWFAGAAKKKGESGERSSNADKLKGQRQAIEEYCQAWNENVCLVFTAVSASKALKTVKAVMSVGKVREYKKPKEWELPAYLRQYLRKAGRSISPRALELLVAIGGEDLGSLINECDKLVLYTVGQDAISDDDVAHVVSFGAEANIFQLSDALGNRDVAKVRQLCTAILGETKAWEYPKVFGYITNYIRILMRIKAFLSHGYSENRIVEATKINAYRVKLGIPAAKRYSEAELRQALGMMLEVDYKMKSGIGDFTESFPLALMDIARVG
ncbi:MAG: DNA polymerase III subunit delta, partial [Bacillota bacterium]|nr:DNA polymerase III subunit delta [Bacillota bacterium]